LKQALFVMAAGPEVDLIIQDRSAACQLSFLRDKQTALLGEAVVLGAIAILAWTRHALLPSPLLLPQSLALGTAIISRHPRPCSTASTSTLLFSNNLAFFPRLHFFKILYSPDERLRSL
jgi:hypothetical protein